MPELLSSFRRIHSQTDKVAENLHLNTQTRFRGKKSNHFQERTGRKGVHNTGVHGKNADRHIGIIRIPATKILSNPPIGILEYDRDALEDKDEKILIMVASKGVKRREVRESPLPAIVFSERRCQRTKNQRMPFCESPR